jgi:hypothetical protein
MAAILCLHPPAPLSLSQEKQAMDLPLFELGTRMRLASHKPTASTTVILVQINFHSEEKKEFNVLDRIRAIWARREN